MPLSRGDVQETRRGERCRAFATVTRPGRRQPEGERRQQPLEEWPEADNSPDFGPRRGGGPTSRRALLAANYGWAEEWALPHPPSARLRDRASGALDLPQNSLGGGPAMKRNDLKPVLALALIVTAACEASSEPPEQWTLEIAGPDTLPPMSPVNFTASATRDGTPWPAAGEPGGFKWKVGSEAPVVTPSVWVFAKEVTLYDAVVDTVPVILDGGLIRCEIRTTTTFHAGVAWSYGADERIQAETATSRDTPRSVARRR